MGLRRARGGDSSDQSVEKYFGAALHACGPGKPFTYRGRKKGPISTENYAKRVEQNREFGIVDQYVRRSSGGWYGGNELDIVHLDGSELDIVHLDRSLHHLLFFFV
jgi:hypothetical protein